ncbi:MAG: hypothetical protein ACO3NK_05305 [Prochlorotrichaceae cyanobacterium]|jgi:hypothetical protein
MTPINARNLQFLEEQLAGLEKAKILAPVEDQVRLQQQIKEKKEEIDRYKREYPQADRLNASVAQNVPPLLPYLADRDPQRDDLDAVLKKLKQQSTKRPIVCILHGDEKQCHDMFLQRLREEILPQSLEIERGSISKYKLRWADRKSDFCRQLEKNLLGDVNFESLGQFNDHLAQIPSPVLIHSQCDTSDWQSQGIHILDSFLAFWQKWPDLAVDQVLIVCLCISYRMEKGLSFCQRYRLRSLNQKINQSLDQLSRSRTKKFDRLITTVLPKLESISCTQALDWADVPASKFLNNDRLIPDLKQSIQLLYRQWQRDYGSDTIPMETLAEHLKKLLSLGISL